MAVSAAPVIRPTRRRIVAAAWLTVVPIVAPHSGASHATGATGATPPAYHSITPTRVLDTRSGLGLTPPVASNVTPGAPTAITLPGDAAGADGVALNVTITDPAADGYATAYPCGNDVPLASNVNYRRGETVANTVIAKPGPDGTVCIVTNVVADIVVDVQGWFPSGSYDAMSVPLRVLDTRNASPLAPGVETPIVTASTGDGAVVANVTAVNAKAAGFVTVYPCGAPPPMTSNLNVAAADAIANLVIARVGAGGVCARASTAVDLVVDVQGRLAPSGGYTGISPARMADTREPIGVTTATRVVAGSVTELSFPITSGIPAVVDTAVVNVTATNSNGSGYLTVSACGQPAPLASNLNIVPGQTRPNLVLTHVGATGTICINTNVTTDLVVDLQGWFAGTAPSPATSPSAAAREHVDTGPGTSMGYLAYLPAGYASTPGRTWPTIVFLHGSGQEGPGTGAALDGVAGNGLPRLYESGTEPTVASGFVVLAPQLPDGSNDPARLHSWLTQVLPRYAVDRDRLYLTGLSAGGFGAFDYLGGLGDANEFAAMVPISGGFTRGVQCANWRRTPVWAFHGESDPMVDPQGSIRTVATVNATCAPIEPLRLTTYPGVGHDAWDPTYDLSGMAPGVTNPGRDPYDVDIYTWMLRHVRSATR